MKKSLFFIAVSIMVLLTSGMWFLYSNKTQIIAEHYPINLIIIITIVGFAVLMGIRIFKSERRDEPEEDELSKKMMRKASSISYFISLYLWLALMFIKDEIKLETGTVLGIGILGMALTLAVTWLVIHSIGIKNE